MSVFVRPSYNNSIVNGFDRDGRPIVWLRPSRENTKPSPTQIRHLIFQLERAIDLMPEGVEKMALVVDYKGATSNNNPSMKTVKEVIHILQNHYVERLGKGIVVNVPFYLSTFFNIIKSLLDPKTKAKVVFNPSLEKLIPNQQLDTEFGGDFNYIYDSNVYLTALCHFCGIKEDGTREEIIPKDLPSTKPEEIQRTLTQQTGDTVEEQAEFARREAEAQKRQDEEARLFAEKGGQMQFDVDDDGDNVNPVSLDNLRDGQVDGQYSGLGNQAVGEGVIAAAAAASIAAATGATKSGQKTTSSTSPASNTVGARALDDTTTQPATINVKSAADNKPVSAPASASKEMHPQATNGTTADSSRPSQPVSTIQPTPADHATTSKPVTPSPTAQPGRKRGGWKLFSSKRGLDKQGNPTTHKHKHISKAFCMHKGAIDPSKNVPTLGTSTEKSTIGTSNTTAVNGTADPSNNRIKIAPEAIEGREERTYNNAPLATNATFGPDAYHTAMEAYPTSNGEEGDGGDYFTNMRKIPIIKPTNVEEEEKDKAKMVKRPTEIMNRLHEGGTGDLVLAFEVKQPPIEPEVEQDKQPNENGRNATAEAATKGEEVVKAKA